MSRKPRSNRAQRSYPAGRAAHARHQPEADLRRTLEERERRASEHHSSEHHLGNRTAWLRAAVLGANDGLISTSALMVGVAAADSGRAAILLAGIAGLTAGALSMAAGEYVSVSSQRDAELAELDRERAE